ncbi:hypothetical protein TELCIR_10713 [Teladorsagia circumcincta]|uniref:Uncharacterized protein n=1 Tax=Teladorsagia circumcincta TaxID=45464 RepID=A0A2G9UBC9_TELCI|nr:hypothetical protein TELCIR_10713 [Teladorsagia circumcincta]
MALMEPNATEERIHVVFPEHVLSADPEYIEAIPLHVPISHVPLLFCRCVLVLRHRVYPIYRHHFLRSTGMVRFFSFLIGEEAIDFEQVKTMACTNRGYMVHVQNMADVEDKVQYAIMNKMAARRKIRLQKTEARGRMFVTTVSFPVIVNGTFMGVAAVNTPLTELNQQAHPSNVGFLCRGLGLAVAKGDDYRWRPKSRTYDYSHVQPSWMSDKQWRVHPHWRYCLLNDTDTNITKEEAFVIYANQMRHSGKLPPLCRPREQLVNRLLLDLEATSALQDSWDLQWQFLKEFVHKILLDSGQ